MALMAAAPIVTQPAPLSRAATNSCQGCAATAQPSVPSASAAAPTQVVSGKPQRACRRGRRATVSAPNMKWNVTAADTRGSDQPVRAATACRKIDGL